MNPMLIEELVRDRGDAPLYSVPASATVGDAVELMAEREVGAVLVMSEDQLVSGIFSERDLLLRVVRPGLDPKSTPLSLVMTRDVRFVSPGTTVEAAMALMYLRHHRHLLVMDGPRVHGLVSMRDLVYLVVKLGSGHLHEAITQGMTQGMTQSPQGQGKAAP
jgi:CBS domain-containing protein